jgi:hypothetical protein
MARHERVSIRIDCDGGCGSSELERDAVEKGWRRVEVSSSTVDGEPLARRGLELCPKCLAKIVVPGLEVAS